MQPCCSSGSPPLCFVFAPSWCGGGHLVSVCHMWHSGKLVPFPCDAFIVFMATCGVWLACRYIYIFIYFIGGVERITPFCCLTVKWVTVLYGGRKMYRIITVSCVDKAGQSWLYIDSLDNRGCHCIQNGTCIVWVCNVQRYKPGQDPYSMWSNYRGLQVLL